MIRRPSMRRWLISTTALAGVLALGAPAALANPEGGVVTQGSATITQPDAKTVQVNQTSNRAVIDWRSFSIAADELTRFNQPSSSAIALNRVTGDQVSQILGRLQANGQIVLVNPNGIVFGADSKIDVGALIASTANIKTENFMAGNMKFDIPGKPNAQIINHGTITAADGGLVAIVSPYLRNSGIIVARLGKVGLAAANGATLDLYGDNLILFQASDKITNQLVGLDGKPVTGLIENDGKIYADGGRVLLTANVAKGVVDNAINTTGLISARAVEQQGGEIVLKGEDAGIVQVSGTLDASGKETGQKGGTVNVLGDVVAQQSTAKVDVSGDSGGGTALIGGDYLGGGTVRNADVAYMAKGAVIDASAITTGNGGKSILWANNTTRSYGSIFARGGRLGGDGGFVETSGKVYLAQEGSVDASAPKGKAGTWLMDPGTIYIQDGVGESNTQNTNCLECTGSYLYRAATSAPAYVNTATINSALSSGNNVWITTDDNSSDIHVDGNILFTKGLGALSDIQLYLLAGRDIYVTSGTIKQTGSDASSSDQADLRVFLGADRSRVGTGSVYIGDAARTYSTIDIGAGLSIEATNLVQIYGTSSPSTYTVNASSNVKIASNITPGYEANVGAISLADRSIRVQGEDGEGNIKLYANSLILQNQGNGASEVAISGALTTTGISPTNIEVTRLAPRQGREGATTENENQATERNNVDSNNKERSDLTYARNLMEYGTNVNGADLGTLAHNVVAGYLRSIEFYATGNDIDTLGDRVRAFDTIRSMVYDSLNRTPVEGKGYNDLLSLIMSGDIKPDMSNQLWRALMIGDQLSPAQQYALSAYNAIREGLDLLAIDPRSTINDYGQGAKSSAIVKREGDVLSVDARGSERHMLVASATFGPDPALVSKSQNSPNAAVTLLAQMDLGNLRRSLVSLFSNSSKSQQDKATVIDKLSQSGAFSASQMQELSTIKGQVLSGAGALAPLSGTTMFIPSKTTQGSTVQVNVTSSTIPSGKGINVSRRGNTSVGGAKQYISGVSAGDPIDTIEMDVGGVRISLSSHSNGGKESYNLHSDSKTDYQCTDLIREYVSDLGFKDASSVSGYAMSVGNGGVTAQTISGMSPVNVNGTSMVFKYNTPDSGSLPKVGAILSQGTGPFNSANPGHVSVIKAITGPDSNGSYTATLIENNLGFDGKEVINRTIQFSPKDGGGFIVTKPGKGGALEASKAVVGWANLEPL